MPVLEDFQPIADTTDALNAAIKAFDESTKVIAESTLAMEDINDTSTDLMNDVGDVFGTMTQDIEDAMRAMLTATETNSLAVTTELTTLTSAVQSIMSTVSGVAMNAMSEITAAATAATTAAMSAAGAASTAFTAAGDASSAAGTAAGAAGLAAGAADLAAGVISTLQDATATLFDSGYYLSQNPDVAAAIDAGYFSNAYDHFVNFGKDEGRASNGFSFATGGIASGPRTGYTATLHGTEAVIPLGDGNKLTLSLADTTLSIQSLEAIGTPVPGGISYGPNPDVVAPTIPGTDLTESLMSSFVPSDLFPPELMSWVTRQQPTIPDDMPEGAAYEDLLNSLTDWNTTQGLLATALETAGFDTLAESIRRTAERGSLSPDDQAIVDWTNATADAALTRALELDLMDAQGLSYRALTEHRLDEVKGMSATDAAIQRQIDAAEDLANTRQIEIGLMEDQGLTYDAMIARRADELAGLSETDAGLMSDRYAQQDANATVGLLSDLYAARGQARDVLEQQRNDELAALSDKDRVIKQAIFAAEDLANTQSIQIKLLQATGETLASTALTRKAELAALSDTDAALMRLIYAAEDLATATDRIAPLFDVLLASMSDEQAFNVLTNTFAAWGDAMPATTDALYDLIDAGGLTTEQITMLADNSALVASAYAHLNNQTQTRIETLNEEISTNEKLQSTLKSLVDEVKSVIDQVEDDFASIVDNPVDLDAEKNRVFAALTAATDDTLSEALGQANDYRAAIMENYNDELSVLEQRKDAIESANESMLDWVNDMRKAVDAAVSPLQRLTESRAQYQTSLAASRAGDTDAMGKLTGNATDYLDAIRSTASDPVEYARAYGQVVGQIESLATVEADAQTARVVNEIALLKDSALIALRDLDYRLIATESGLTTRLTGVETLLTDLSAQVTTLETVDHATTLTLMDIAARTTETDRLIAAIAKSSTPQASIGPTAPGPTANSTTQMVGDTWRSQVGAISTGLGRTATQNELDYYGGQLARGTMNIGQVQDKLMEYIRNNSFAEGGYHSGGLRLVGERGPEFEVTGPSHITPNHSIASAFSEGNRDMVIELAALREEVKELRLEQRRQHHESARYQRDTADTLVKIDQIGIKTTAEA
jgi:hypothetical protein